MSTLRPLFPLLIAAGILLAGNGLQGTLIAVRGAAEGFSPGFIGFTGSAYFAGFLIGCLVIPRILRSVGHIRAFASLAALAAAGSLLLILSVEPVTWSVVRFAMGFCFSGLFTTVESWINWGVSNRDRGRVLSLYRLIDLAAVTGAQYLIPLFGVSGFAIFAVMAIMITLSLVPVSLADRSNPEPPAAFRLELASVWRLSPLACMGCISIGLTNSAFRLVGPIYAQEIGLSISDVATFMSAGIVGGAVLQYPFGLLSDRYDRRTVLLIATTGAMISGMAISAFAGTSALLNFAGIFAFGAFALPLFSLSAAHANDHAIKGEFVQIAAGLMFFFSTGAMMGPLIASFLMEQFGPRFLFSYTSAVHAALLIITVYRMRVRAGVPAEERKGFAPLLRTSPAIFKMARKAERDGDDREKQ